MIANSIRAQAVNNCSTPIVLYLRHPHLKQASIDLSVSCPKNGDVPKSSLLPIVALVPSAGAISKIDVGSYRGCHRHPHCAYPCASGPGALAIGPINRSIEEERRVQVLVRDNNVDQALRVLKKKMQREGLLPMKPRVIPGAPGRGGPARAPRF